MATQRLWGSPRAKPPPCTMGKHDQYLNPPRYAFPLRDACLSLDDLLSPSLFFSPPFGLYIRLRVSSRIGRRRAFAFVLCKRSLQVVDLFAAGGVRYRCLFIFFCFFDVIAQLEAGLEWPRLNRSTLKTPYSFLVAIRWDYFVHYSEVLFVE